MQHDDALSDAARSARDALLAEIFDQPEAETPRLVLADWCDEHGVGGGAFLRAQERLAALPRKSRDRAALQAEVRALGDAVDPAWLSRFDRSDRYTFLWPGDTVKAAVSAGWRGQPLPALFGGYNANSDFHKMGVGPGDWVYPIHLYLGRIAVLTRIRVSAWVDRPADLPTFAYGGQFAVGTGSAPIDPDRILPVPLLERLAFRSKTAVRPIAGVVDGRLQRSVPVVGVFRLTLRSAMDFASLF